MVMAWAKLRIVVRCFMSRLDIRKLRVTCQLLVTTYLSITKMGVPERIELSRSARQADIMATRSWDPTGASGGDRTHWLRRASVLRTGAIPSRRRLQNGGRDRSRTRLCQDL